ncbi:MAG: alpha/beta hydrolase-fold protein [Agriterribacter sp.]
MHHLYKTFLLVAITLPILAQAQSKNPGQSYPVTIMNSELKVLHAAQNGESYDIYIWVPDSYTTSDSSYPVLYLTDANTYFGMLTGMAHNLQWTNEMPETIIVGIAYSLDSEKTIDDKWNKWLALRLRDLTPVNNPQSDKEMAIGDIKSGGGADFLRFIQLDLIPFIEKNYRVKSNERTYAGFSLGGLFGLYTMLEDPQLFQNYILGSPSVWYKDNYIVSLLKKYAGNHTDLPVRLYVSVGSLEEEINAGMVRNMLEFTSILKSKNYKTLLLKTDILENETHQSSPGICFLHGLHFLFRQ